MAIHIPPVRIQRIKERWEREVLYGLARQGNVGSNDRERPWLTPSFLAGAIVTTGVRSSYCRSGRRRVGMANWSCS